MASTDAGNADGTGAGLLPPLWRASCLAGAVCLFSISWYIPGSGTLLADDMSPGNLTPWSDDGNQPTGALQKQIEALQPGETLKLPPGSHEGPVIVRQRGITIDGGGTAVIDGGGQGTVVRVLAAGVTIKNLRITGSGNAYDQVHGGLAIQETSDTVIDNIDIDQCLFGIDVSGAARVTIRNSRITSKPLALGLRGDAIRLWSSRQVEIIDNEWFRSRDTVSWYSRDVVFRGNRGRDSRYSLHSMYSTDLTIRDNVFTGNSVGVFIMYGERTRILGNRVERSSGPGAAGIGMKETSHLFAQDNTVIYNAVGILVDNSPWQPTSRIWFTSNRVAFNHAGIVFAGNRPGAEFRANNFTGNTMDIDTESRGKVPAIWHGNYWDQYDGFDRNHDGIGDTPFVLRKFGDITTGSHPMAQFFKGAPVLALIEMVERLVPLTDPIELARDDQPHLRSGRAGAIP